MILPGENGGGLCRDGTMPKDSLVCFIETITASARISSRAHANPHRIGRPACLENHRLKDGISLPENTPSSPSKAAHLQLRTDSCA